MKYRIILQPRALQDLEEAYRWIAERSPEAAARWYNGLTRTIATLQDHPQRCGLASESSSVGREIRQLLYGRRGGVYRVLFVVQETQVHILHIRHAARQDIPLEELGADEPGEGE
jgi:plasmid stabilization system protein ParE